MNGTLIHADRLILQTQTAGVLASPVTKGERRGQCHEENYGEDQQVWRPPHHFTIAFGPAGR